MTMDEYKAKATQNLNITAIGFNPYDFLAQSTHPTGECYWYIPLNIQIKWFRSIYPNGAIDVSTEQVENGHRVTASIYADYDDHLLATAQSEKYVTPDRNDTQEWAQFAAKSIALESAGFGDHMSLGRTGAPLTSEENALYDNISDPSILPQTKKHTMTLEQAKALPCRIARYGQMSLGQLAVVDPHSMQWIIQESNFDEEFKKAALMIVQSYQSVPA